MKTENVVLMRQAREALKGKWGLAIGTFVIFFLILMVIQTPSLFFPYLFILTFPAGILTLIIAGPLVVGMATFVLTLSRNQDASLSQLFLGFNRFGVCLAAYLLIALFTILWSLLLIIPGIIAAISYSMTYFILAEDESIGAMEAIDKSKSLMQGNKWKYFCLCFRFLGWAILCILTLGIGFLWLAPYIQVSLAKFYDDVKSQKATIVTGQPA